MATSTKTKTQKGSINVTTENIFPIIKKFLYSDHEIFLRELVSNAVDATQKRKTISKSGEVDAFKNENPQVHVTLDKEAKTITISDNGIGMTAVEIDKYINQIAFSGATEFLDKYKDDDAKQAIIGHFGLGFYSSFMVAERVDIISKSAKKGAKAVKWSCDGSPDYTIDPANKKEAGTDIILHIAEDSVEFLEDERLGGILNKYCKFMPVEIVFGTRTVEEEDPSGEKDEKGKAKKISVEVPRILNNTDPVWMKKPADLTEEDYSGFYRELYPMNMEDPLFNIHLNVDFPFNLTGVLYFPPLKKTMELQKNKIHLYSNQVFITDNVENIVPDFLTMLHGVIDSPDIPLNVSRSYLQEDANVKKISGYISKKVADKLASMFKNDRESFEKRWDDLRIFVEYGILTDEKFSERSKKFYLYKDTDGKCMTHDELIAAVGESQKDKSGKVILPYTSDASAQHTFVKEATDRAYKVLVMEGPLAAHVVGKLEQTHTDVQFKRVDSEIIENLIEKDEETTSILDEKQQEVLKPIVQSAFPESGYDLKFAAMSPTSAPFIITRSEWMRRMKEQQAVGGGGFQMFGEMPEKYDVTINSNHPLATKLLKEKNKKVRSTTVREAADLARLSQGILKGEELAAFIERGFKNLQ
ncbi:MAG: molecular chaperone HtpG [Bacteroidetes bacterium]|nr:molecular chaperone HtpG [Bacteroidota bacterium]MDA0980993.1 molecular chaperone HtpG [Bacteroidota bacterium]